MTHPVRWLAPFVTLGLILVACGGEAPDTDGPPAQDTTLARDTDPSARPAREPADTTGRPGPSDPATAPPGGSDTGAVGVDEWTAGVVEGGAEAGRASGPATPTITGVRTARHAEYDRFVLEFDEAGGLPAFHLEYVDRPVRECGSGNVVELPGDGWLEIRMPGAKGHDEGGRVTVEAREGAPGLPVLLAHRLTCDFEANVTWVLAVASPNRFRVLDLREPYRLVVDVRH